tara:strand:- start:2167 stop:2271 length:105 start_codon:yes stop_codon:yes gene_type:complete
MKFNTAGVIKFDDELKNNKNYFADANYLGQLIIL